MKTLLVPFVVVLISFSGCGKGVLNSSPEADGLPSTIRTDTRTISFEHLAGGDSHAASLEGPALFVAGEASEITSFTGMLSDPELVRRIGDADFDNNWVVAIFRGMVGTGGHGIRVKEIEKENETLKVAVDLSDPKPDQFVIQVISYPFHIITIPKKDLIVTGETTWSVVRTKATPLVPVIDPIDKIDPVDNGDDPDVTILRPGGDSGQGGVRGGSGPVTVGGKDTPSDRDGNGRVVPRGDFPGDTEPVDPDKSDPLPRPTEPDGGPTGGTETPGVKADIRGAITRMTPSGEDGLSKGIIGAILVEGKIEKDTGFDRAFVEITRGTLILKKEGEEFRKVSFESLKIGQETQAVFTGPVRESYPVQATAREFIILN